MLTKIDQIHHKDHAMDFGITGGEGNHLMIFNLTFPLNILHLQVALLESWKHIL